jgi:hypothetical protein
MRLDLFLIAAFCRRDQSLSYQRETRLLERAMGIEPLTLIQMARAASSLQFTRAITSLFRTDFR